MKFSAETIEGFRTQCRKIFIMIDLRKKENVNMAAARNILTQLITPVRIQQEWCFLFPYAFAIDLFLIN